MVVRPAKHFQVSQISDGLYVAIANEGTGAMANVGFVDLGESILVFDSFNTQQAASELRNVIQELTGKPISHLINSHWHGDHVRGNQAFQDATIVATDKTKSIMKEIHPARIAKQRSELEELGYYIQNLETQCSSLNDEIEKENLRKQISLLKEIKISLPTLELILPNETFETNWHVQGINRRAECLTLGGGHTACDAILYIPDAKVCYIGDLVAVQNHMLIVDGDIRNWVSILEELKGWEIEWVIPGHGPVGGKEWIGQAADYLTHLIEVGETFRDRGFTLDQLADVRVPDAYENWSAREVYFKNVKHLVSQSG